ncbi:MAG: hypothetical protein ABL883_01605 [Terricaulis sp.]
MAEAPIPVRIPALEWRAPAFLWIPAGLALSIGWPAALFPSSPNLRQLALVGGASVFALAMTGLWLRWMIRGAPKARRVIVRHIVVWGAVVSAAAPFALTMAAAAPLAPAGNGSNLSFGAVLSMVPLSLLLGLPAALVSGSIFALVALIHPSRRTPR